MLTGKSLNGMILVNKPVDFSSNKITNIVKRKFSAKKAGHTGTLDPFASGLLPVCINRGTKLVRYLIDKDKEYIGTIKLGQETDTLDKTGEIIKEIPVPALTDNDIFEAVNKFKGKIKQIPPAFSALKHNGVPLYKHARKGIIIKKDPREITIHELEVLNIELPFIKIRVKCSAGTYIRTLASDIANTLETCGHLTSLERTMCGDFSLENAYSPEEIEEKVIAQQELKILTPLESMISFMPKVKIDNELIPDVFQGKKISEENFDIMPELKTEVPFQLISKENKLIAIIRKQTDSIFFTYDAVFN